MKPINVGDLVFFRRPMRTYLSARVLAIHDDYVLVSLPHPKNFESNVRKSVSRKMILTEEKVKELKERFTRGPRDRQDDEC